MNADRWIPVFLDAIQAERNAADNTLLAYHRDLAAFSEFLAARGHDFNSANRDTIEDFLIDLARSGMAGSTRARRLSAIRQIYRFGFEEGWRDDNPAARVKGPKPARHLPDTLTEAAERMLAPSPM